MEVWRGLLNLGTDNDVAMWAIAGQAILDKIPDVLSVDTQVDVLGFIEKVLKKSGPVAISWENWNLCGEFVVQPCALKVGKKDETKLQLFIDFMVENSAGTVVSKSDGSLFLFCPACFILSYLVDIPEELSHSAMFGLFIWEESIITRWKKKIKSEPRTSGYPAVSASQSSGHPVASTSQSSQPASKDHHNQSLSLQIGEIFSLNEDESESSPPKREPLSPPAAPVPPVQPVVETRSSSCQTEVKETESIAVGEHITMTDQAVYARPRHRTQMTQLDKKTFAPRTRAVGCGDLSWADTREIAVGNHREVRTCGTNVRVSKRNVALQSEPSTDVKCVQARPLLWSQKVGTEDLLYPIKEDAVCQTNVPENDKTDNVTYLTSILNNIRQTLEKSKNEQLAKVVTVIDKTYQVLLTSKTSSESQEEEWLMLANMAMHLPSSVKIQESGSKDKTQPKEETLQKQTSSDVTKKPTVTSNTAKKGGKATAKLKSKQSSKSSNQNGAGSVRQSNSQSGQAAKEQRRQDRSKESSPMKLIPINPVPPAVKSGRNKVAPSTPLSSGPKEDLPGFNNKIIESDQRFTDSFVPDHLQQEKWLLVILQDSAKRGSKKSKEWVAHDEKERMIEHRRAEERRKQREIEKQKLDMASSGIQDLIDKVFNKGLLTPTKEYSQGPSAFLPANLKRNSTSPIIKPAPDLATSLKGIPSDVLDKVKQVFIDNPSFVSPIAKLVPNDEKGEGEEKGKGKPKEQIVQKTPDSTFYTDVTKTVEPKKNLFSGKNAFVREKTKYSVPAHTLQNQEARDSPLSPTDDNNDEIHSNPCNIDVRQEDGLVDNKQNIKHETVNGFQNYDVGQERKDHKQTLTGWVVKAEETVNDVAKEESLQSSAAHQEEIVHENLRENVEDFLVSVRKEVEESQAQNDEKKSKLSSPRGQKRKTDALSPENFVVAVNNDNEEGRMVEVVPVVPSKKRQKDGNSDRSNDEHFLDWKSPGSSHGPDRSCSTSTANEEVAVWMDEKNDSDMSLGSEGMWADSGDEHIEEMDARSETSQARESDGRFCPGGEGQISHSGENVRVMDYEREIQFTTDLSELRRRIGYLWDVTQEWCDQTVSDVTEIRYLQYCKDTAFEYRSKLYKILKKKKVPTATLR